MALYRYFPSKADLLELMIDSAGGSATNFGKLSLPWNVRLKKWARCCLAIYPNHPWFMQATSARQSLMGPNFALNCIIRGPGSHRSDELCGNSTMRVILAVH